MNRARPSAGAALRFGSIAAASLLAFGFLAGCSGELASEPEDTALEADRIDQLAALGYVEVASRPADPGLSGVVILDEAALSPGYSLYTASFDCAAHLIDLEGNVVHGWRDDPSDDGRVGVCTKWGQADLLANGDLLVPVNARPPAGPRAGTHLLRLDWAGNVVWHTPLRAHHDAEQAPSGKILALSKRTREDHAFAEGNRLIDNTIVVLSAEGVVEREISLYDALRENPLGFELVPRSPIEGGAIDLLHANSVETLRHAQLATRDPLYRPGNLLVSIRHQDLVLILDPEREEIVWAYGPGELSHQHDAQMLENGNVLVFDNGLEREWSRVVEIDPLRNEIVWSYGDAGADRFFTAGRGAAQKLPNGNVLVANSNEGEAFEVTSDGRIVWRFYHPELDPDGHREVIVRMVRYAPERIEPFLASAGRKKSR